MADIFWRMFKLAHVMLLGALLLFTPTTTVAHPDSSLRSERRPAATICRAPLYWYVSDIDPRFGFSRSEVTRAAITAAEMWNQAAGTELLLAGDSQHDAIAVSLVYDHRQQLQDYIADTDAQIARLEDQVEALDTDLRQARDQLEDRRQDIEALNARISRKTEQVDEMIAQHGNQRGQVSRDIAQQINQLQSDAQQLVDTHNAKLADYNQRQALFNQQVEARNRLAQQQNTLVSQRNQRIQSRETEWRRRGLGSESGQHNIRISTNRRGVRVDDERISIYSASNQLGLITILAHEFGHAIGINHVQGGASIMSARLETTTPGAYPQQLSQDDLAALRSVCNLE